MTNVYRTRSAPRAPGHLADARRIVRITLFTLAIVALAWLGVTLRTQSAIGAQTIRLVQTTLVPGLTRSDCYAWLRAHHLVATNVAFAAWKKNRFGVWYRSNDGAWPQHNSAHPDVEIKLSTGSAIGCGMTVAEQITFDRFDRIEHVAASTPYWSCG